MRGSRSHRLRGRRGGSGRGSAPVHGSGTRRPWRTGSTRVGSGVSRGRPGGGRCRAGGRW
ncbi:hypothetical protein EXU32_00965 [Janibacter limosus]|uniref:Uncharacterized protein n=1 Tax=Janibacter limosus TaxID=53458 RepID=A0A4P6MXJ9_9MICO|nr:hypothetical protein EXU32_00965 [Janibacter limosus]